MDEDFALANGAFDLMSLVERRLVLSEMVTLHYPRIEDRFHEAVYRVCQLAHKKKAGAPPSPEEAKDE